ncbi:YybH family protein [Gemmatimonadota bacterium]
MKNDEQSIRQWFESWMKATREGDLQLARGLIADDAVFLVPGADRMDKESFAAAATATDPNTDFELDCSIQEIEILGDHAWLWTKISLTMTGRRSGSGSLMAGHSLSILKRQGDGWVVIRDANTMVMVEQE